jgi:hypothetical protein
MPEQNRKQQLFLFLMIKPVSWIVLFYYFVVVLGQQQQNTTTTTTAANQGESDSVLKDAASSIADSAAFAILAFVVSVILIVKEYFDSVYEIAESYPRLVSAFYLLSAWAFAILCSLLAFLVKSSDGVTVTKGSLLYAGFSMAFG